ncbi:MAG: hypothetical protein WBQ30_13090, partial [Thermoanaerobaculia bacterium]
MRLERRYRGSCRSSLALGIIGLTCAGISQAQPDERLIGYTKQATDTQLKAEELIQSIPSSEMFGKHLLYLTEEPHPTGSERNMELAEYVRDRFTEYGLQDAYFHDTPALLSYGRSASVELLEPIQMKLS